MSLLSSLAGRAPALPRVQEHQLARCKCRILCQRRALPLVQRAAAATLCHPVLCFGSLSGLPPLV